MKHIQQLYFKMEIFYRERKFLNLALTFEFHNLYVHQADHDQVKKYRKIGF